MAGSGRGSVLQAPPPLTDSALEWKYFQQKYMVQFKIFYPIGTQNIRHKRCHDLIVFVFPSIVSDTALIISREKK